MDLKAIPKSMPWLVVVDNVITSAHRSITAAREIRTTVQAPANARVLEQNGVSDFHIGQVVVKNLDGKAVPYK